MHTRVRFRGSRNTRATQGILQHAGQAADIQGHRIGRAKPRAKASGGIGVHAQGLARAGGGSEI